MPVSSAMDGNLPIPLRHYLRLGFVSDDCGSKGQAALRGFARGTGRGRPMFEQACSQEDIASCISRIASIGESPAAQQPGKSGAMQR